MYLDNEENILQSIHLDISSYNCELLYSNNAFSRKIYKCLKQSNEMKNDNGHDAEPPDFYSDDLNIMFDVARVNDSEIKKSYNPTFIYERKMQQEVESSWIRQEIPDVKNNLMCIDPEWGSDKIHKMNHYLKNMKRVIAEHLSSKGHPNKITDIWLRKHPNISRKGLLIYDETENYFQGICVPHPSGEWTFISDSTKPIIFYKPWMDKQIVEPIYKSDCDFLIWYMPYKWCGFFTQAVDKYFPHIVILDTRYPRNDYIDYTYSMFTRT